MIKETFLHEECDAVYVVERYYLNQGEDLEQWREWSKKLVIHFEENGWKARHGWAKKSKYYRVPVVWVSANKTKGKENDS